MKYSFLQQCCESVTIIINKYGRCSLGLNMRCTDHLFIFPCAFCTFQTFSICFKTGLKIFTSLEKTSVKSTLLCVSKRFTFLCTGQSFRRWFSLSITLHVLHISLIEPLKFFPHSNIPKRAMIRVFVSCLLQRSISGVGFLVYDLSSRVSTIWAVLVFRIWVLFSIVYFKLCVNDLFPLSFCFRLHGGKIN